MGCGASSRHDTDTADPATKSRPDEAAPRGNASGTTESDVVGACDDGIHGDAHKKHADAAPVEREPAGPSTAGQERAGDDDDDAEPAAAEVVSTDGGDALSDTLRSRGGTAQGTSIRADVDIKIEPASPQAPPPLSKLARRAGSAEEVFGEVVDDDAFGEMLDGSTYPDELSTDAESSLVSSLVSGSVPGISGGVCGLFMRGKQEGGGKAGTGAKILKPPALSRHNSATAEDMKGMASELRSAETTGDANLGHLDFQLVPRAHLKPLMSGEYPNIRSLDLSENNLRELPWDFFARLQCLEVVKLHNNKLTTIPPTLLMLPLLRELLLDHNQLTDLLLPSVDGPSMTSVTVDLPFLTILGVEWNRLAAFPAAFVQGCPSLRTLYLSENPIPALPPPALFASRAYPLSVKLDNRPILLDEAAAAYADNPVLQFEWNKIYPDKVLDHVYLGSLRTAQTPEIYAQLGIGHILTAGRNLDVTLAPGVDQLEINVDDVQTEDITPFFEQCFRYINTAIAEKRGVLLHCFAGLSRSVTIMVAYLMYHQYPMTADEALARVKEVRPAARPNDGFMRRLRAYGDELRVKHGDAPASPAAAAP